MSENNNPMTPRPELENALYLYAEGESCMGGPVRLHRLLYHCEKHSKTHHWRGYAYDVPCAGLSHWRACKDCPDCAEVPARYSMRHGESYPFETDSEEELMAVKTEAEAKLGIKLVRSDEWRSRGFSRYSPNFGGVLT